jgi:hypothetical protein
MHPGPNVLSVQIRWPRALSARISADVSQVQPAGQSAQDQR